MAADEAQTSGQADASGRASEAVPAEVTGLQGEPPDVAAFRIAAGVATTTLMTAVDVFLVSALITAPHATPHEYGAPIPVLLISGLGFLYGTLVYANAYATMRSGEGAFDRQMNCGNIISEALGVYLLALGIPLAVAAITTGAALAWSIFAASIIGFWCYAWSDYSLLSTYIGKWVSNILVVVLAGLAAATLIVLRGHTSTGLRLWLAGALVVIAGLVALVGIVTGRSKER